MPELPEVETIVRELQESHLIGTKITGVKVFWPGTVAEPEAALFCRQIVHQKILKISRRGKFIVFGLDFQTLLVHLRMTGKFVLSRGRPKEPHERVRLELGDGRLLHYDDQRKFGKWYLLSDPEVKMNVLGIEPLSEEFTLEFFKAALKKSSQRVKPFLLNQRYIVGLGNIYVDEALWEAKIHPSTKVNTLNLKGIQALHSAIQHVLKQGIAHMGTSLGSKQANYFSVSGRRGGHQTQLKIFRRDGLPCPRCGTTIIKIKIAERGTHLCPNCQKV